jgi:hypothetical protein
MRSPDSTLEAGRDGPFQERAGQDGPPAAAMDGFTAVLKGAISPGPGGPERGHLFRLLHARYVRRFSPLYAATR